MRRIRPLVFLVLIFLLTFQGLLLAGDTGSFVLSDSIPHRIASITIIGNKTTRDHIILRELTFHTGDTLDEAGLIKRAHRSEENVYNTSLFNSVHINWLPDQGSWNVFILVTER
ncbi:MAG: hypothetical protein IT242_08790, partial [Bacteroidia bacterium]|nr:hypothetical protein [Bacteroidia bacterium]